MRPEARLTSAALLLLGFGLGLRHATDADHLVVISGLLQRGHSLRGAVRVAVLWGLGHSAAFIGIGLLVVLADRRLPPAFEALADLLVAGMLIVLGAAHLARAHTSCITATSPAPARPLLIGVVHGSPARRRSHSCRPRRSPLAAGPLPISCCSALAPSSA